MSYLVASHVVPMCAITGIFGGMPSESLVVISEQAADPSSLKLGTDGGDNASRRTNTIAAADDWSVQSSLFAARAREADSRGFYDSQEIVREVRQPTAILISDRPFSRIISYLRKTSKPQGAEQGLGTSPWARAVLAVDEEI